MSTISPFISSSNIVYSCKYPIVWCPKVRRKVLVDEVAVRLENIICETSAEKQVEIIEMEIVKGRSSRLLRQEYKSLRTRLPTLWTNSYFISTVGGAPLEIIKQ